MGDIKETFLRKYGVWEYVLFVLGLLVLIKFSKWIWESDFAVVGWSEIGVHVFLMALGILLIAAPFSILEFARKKVGLKTREEKLKQD